ncbi:MAG TPA: ACT domain-containing protein [Clostridia bacterium]|nr:ACT domain-containing protein [Clostridia bacterium]
MKSEYLIVHKSALPECYEKVVEARELLRRGAAREVSEAARMAGISRSTFYKYKDLVFTPGESASCKKAIFSMLLSHERGVLGRVLNSMSDMGANVLTIMQNPPIGERASVVISVDISDLDRSVEETTMRLGEMHGVERVGLLDME